MGKPKVEKDSSERWLLTYADLMNLLLIFFIILYAMSKTDQAKFNAFAESFKQELGLQSSSKSIIEMESNKISMVEKTSQNTADKTTEAEKLKEAQKQKEAEIKQQKIIEDKINNLIKEKNIQGSVEVKREDRGIVISISTNVLFERGSDTINPAYLKVIGSIAQILKETYPNQIAIEGHTDNDPISSTKFTSNWELSSARATKVLRYIVDNFPIEPNRISAVGYGEFRPKAPNDTPANKAKNRKVNVVIIDAAHGTTMAKATVENSKTIKPNANVLPTP